MNIFTHRIGDDFYWENISGTSQRVRSVLDIFSSIYNYYTANGGMAGGRIVAVFITQLFLLVGKSYFNIANAIVYTLLILLMYFHIAGNISLKRFNLLLYGAINLFVWYFVPAWGEDLLCLTMTCFYAWPVVIILFFFVPLRKKSENPEYKFGGIGTFFYLFLGLLAGLSYENAAAGAFIFLLAYFVCKAIKKEKPALFEILGAVGFLIGFAILLAAPGNYARLNSYDIVLQHGFMYRIVYGFVLTTNIFFKYAALLTGLSIVLGIELLIHQKEKISFPSYLYLLTGIASAYSMIFSPVFIERTFFPVSIFVIILFLSLFRQIKLPEIMKRNAKPFVIVMLVCFSFSLIKAGIAIRKVYRGDETVNVHEVHYGRVN
jgi:hypothetical protein